MSRTPGAALAPRALAVALLCAALYLPGLGASGLSATEGHRAIPGWTMLESGRPLRLELFERAYLRKPPGMPWAVALSSAALGPTPFAARLVSAAAATGMALAAFAFAARWFGPRHALAAGLAQALLPVLWSPARAAEIEALHAFMLQLATLALIDAALATRPARATPAILAAALAAGTLAKGPAGYPAIAGAIAGIAVAARSLRPPIRFRIWIPVALAFAVATVLWAATLRASLEPGAVTQGPGEFLWNADRLLQIATLPPAVLIMGLPATLALLFPFGRDALAEPFEPGALRLARALAFSCLAGIAAYLALGVSNPRYALPALACAPPLVAYVARGMAPEGPFTDTRRRIARALHLGHPLALAAALAIGAAVAIPVNERARARASGRDAGLALAASLDAPAELWADDLVEARPEVLWYARQAAAAAGRPLRVRWMKPDLLDGRLPPDGALLALRFDPGSTELARYQHLVDAGRLRPLGTARAHRFEFAWFRVETP